MASGCTVVLDATAQHAAHQLHIISGRLPWTETPLDAFNLTPHVKRSEIENFDISFRQLY
jgi:hypothetical protein